MTEQRAKNFEGMLTILAEATLVLKESSVAFDILGVKENAVRAYEARRTLDRLAFDLSSGLVDLRTLPFDAQKHDLVFTPQTSIVEAILEEDDDDTEVLFDVPKIESDLFDYDATFGSLEGPGVEKDYLPNR